VSPRLGEEAQAAAAAREDRVSPRQSAPAASPPRSPFVAGTPKVKFAGLTQNRGVDPAVWLKIPVSAFELTRILGPAVRVPHLRGAAVDRDANESNKSLRLAGQQRARAPLHEELHQPDGPAVRSQRPPNL
jgi:hypothetical protein